jgi:TrmH family RNA methyltransferase
MLPEIVFYSESMLGTRGRKLIDRFARHKIPTESVLAKDINYISGTKTSQGLVGIFKLPEYNLNELINDQGNYVLLDNISDPGNAGTLIRSALAFGFNMVLMTPNSVEIFNPKVIRSSSGAIFGIPVIAITLNGIKKLRKEIPINIIIGDLNGVDSLFGIKGFNDSCAMIFGIGSESIGLSQEIRELADIKLRVFHSNKVESLNAAVAGSLLMKEIYDRFIRKAIK